MAWNLKPMFVLAPPDGEARRGLAGKKQTRASRCWAIITRSRSDKRPAKAQSSEIAPGVLL
jgi:hypothetical protein